MARQDIRTVGREHGESTLQLARRRRREHEVKLRRLQGRLAALELQRSRVSRLTQASDPSVVQDLEREIDQVRDEIADYFDAVRQAATMIDCLVHRREAEAMFVEFDRLAEGLVEISTEVAIHTSKVPILLQAGARIAVQLHDLLDARLPKDSALRSSAGIGIRQMFPPVDGPEAESRLRALQETASLGEFVRNQLGSIRRTAESELKRLGH